ncbi:PEP/pyruvate-binding domain-containing protein [Pseudodesulfovibrio cashew]|nr:PEP/pyruvate-binding domain-containing protein [Pseudodesulfovibrio cashew]
MKQALKTLFNCIRRSPEGRSEAAQRFLAKSENFRLLLAANNTALETMAEMSEEARSECAFGIAHVKAQSLKAATGVRQMIERLCLMSPGKYEALRDVFNAIVREMDQSISGPTAPTPGPLVIGLDRVRAEDLAETGSKVALLGEIRAALGVTVPKGFSITASAFRLFMERTGLGDEISRLIQIHDGRDLEELRALEEAIRAAIDMTPIPSEIKEAIQTQCERLGKVRLAVRSSALGEDSAGASFAGQFRSELGVRPDRVMEAYRSVVASLYSATAMTYMLNRGLREDETAMAVGCMEMVDAVAGGVIYTRSPMGAGDDITVIAVSGLPCAAVDGSSQADSWTVDRKTLSIRDREIAEKCVRYVAVGGSRVRKEKLYGEKSVAPAIGDETAVRLATLAKRIETYFRHPQDIEWALSRNDRIVILQCRPLTLERAPDLHGEEETGAAPPPAWDGDLPFALLTDAVTACPGAAAGYVFLVDSTEDMFAFPEGGVLLARYAKPMLSALLPRASALVAEHGSPVGHLANVAREFGIPALIGAPDAVERLSGVGTVTVGNGAVYLGRRQGVLDRAPARRARRASEVAMALERVLAHIVPLNLTDPESPDFRPEKCASLHDITRFCHEKGVAEMFAKGCGPTANARKLEDGRVMRYWLVDIGGGTADPDGSGVIRLEDIRSNAMRAVWHGMTAVKWQGPPPPSAEGFLSVLTSAAGNPALAAGARNPMGDRNYFIVGAHYCNLQSRFGFHFCTVEGFAGDDPGGNYALFQFKGGGADMARRHARARLVAGVMEKRGFLAEVHDDALYARLEGASRQGTEQALAMIGYLLMHTRQTDMAMGGSEAAARYAEQYERDIEAVLASLPEHGEGARS